MDRSQLKYAKTHEWVALEGDVATIGISDFAVRELTDLVYLALPGIGKKLTAGTSFGEVESVKAASDLYAPVAGEVVAVNSDLPEHLDWLSSDAFGKGWIIKLKLAPNSNLDHLMDAKAYQTFCDNQSH
jgi:glycine cleavage system H protein